MPIMMRFDQPRQGSDGPSSAAGTRRDNRESGGRRTIVTAAARDDDNDEKKNKKPARERDPNDYLSLSRSEPDRLAGSSGRLKMCLSTLRACV